MEYKELMPGIQLPALGIGTFRMGDRSMAVDSLPNTDAIHAIQTAVQLGMTHIDTAERYGRGHAEALVGEAIKAFDRERLFITSKVRPEHLRYDDVITAARDSLRRLQTTYLDLYLIHNPSHEIPISETMPAMDYLVDNKLVRFIGVSNFSVKELEAAQHHAKHKIVANQIEYNLLVRNRGRVKHSPDDIESRIIPYCQQNQILVIAYRPLALGELARSGIQLLDQLAAKYGKTQAQIAINWLISKPNIITVVKSSNIEHLTENMGAFGWQLRSEDLHHLDSLGI